MENSTVLTQAQQKALISPARIEIVEWLVHTGPQSVARIGEALGRAPDSLYYHLRKLVKVGLLRETRDENLGKRGEATYETVSRAFHSVCDPTDEVSVEIERAGLGALLRLTERTYSRSLENPEIKTHGEDCDLQGRRTRVHLDEDARAELNRRVDDLFAFLQSHATSTKGRATSVTLVSCPSEKQ